MVSWRPDNSQILPGFLIEILIVTILRGTRPLWKIDEFLRRKEKLDLMLKGNDVTIQQLNDSAFGRVLDKLQTINYGGKGDM